MAAEVSNINVIGTIDRCMLEPGYGILNNARLWVKYFQEGEGDGGRGDPENELACAPLRVWFMTNGDD